jgi:cytochrome c5
MKILAIAGSVLVAVLVSAAEPQDKPDPRDNGPGTIDVTAYPAPQQKQYDVYAAKCSKCHPLARSINAHFNATDWKRYMKRMIRRPNSGINEEQAAQIYEFLKFYTLQLGIKE